MESSLREVATVLELLGGDRSHGTVRNWTHDLADAQADPPPAQPPRVAVDENRIEVDGAGNPLHVAIETESKLLLETDVCDLLLAVNGEASHVRTATLGWDICWLTTRRYDGPMAGPRRRYSYPGMGLGVIS